jgi:hypothetical protein
MPPRLKPHFAKLPDFLAASKYPAHSILSGSRAEQMPPRLKTHIAKLPDFLSASNTSPLDPAGIPCHGIHWLFIRSFRESSQGLGHHRIGHVGKGWRGGHELERAL